MIQLTHWYPISYKVGYSNYNDVERTVACPGNSCYYRKGGYNTVHSSKHQRLNVIHNTTDEKFVSIIIIIQ